MRDNPGLNEANIAACLRTQYGIQVASLRFLPIGHDFSAAVYRVTAQDGTPYFLKIRFGPVNELSLLVPSTLTDRGIPNILAPLKTRSSASWCSIDGFCVILYPFITGENAKVADLSADQWREFGATLRAVHDSDLNERVRERVRRETFALPSAALVRRLFALIGDTTFAGPAATQLATFWQDNSDRIQRVLVRAEELGMHLQSRSFVHVLCHSDIHRANILVGDDGRIHLIDWDDPIIAPRERDLLFVVGSRIAGVVEPDDEIAFFAGYGPVEIDPTALIYYRYERIVEDLGEFGKSVFLDPSIAEETRIEEADLAMSFFYPNGDIDRAETVVFHHARGPS